MKITCTSEFLNLVCEENYMTERERETERNREKLAEIKTKLNISIQNCLLIMPTYVLNQR